MFKRILFALLLAFPMALCTYGPGGGMPSPIGQIVN